MKRMECRIIITHWGRTFELGMFDPVGMKYEALGRHDTGKIDRVVSDLRVRMERERHVVTFSELTGPR